MEILKTEEGLHVMYNVTYFIVFTKRHEIEETPSQRVELYKPYELTIHEGAGINIYGVKIFSELKNAERWCVDNRPKEKHKNTKQ